MTAKYIVRNAGQQVLAAYMQATGLTYDAASSLLGCSKQMVHYMAAGEKTPGAELAAKLAQPPWGIQPQWWKQLPYVPSAVPITDEYVTPDYDASGITRKLLHEQIERVRRRRHEAEKALADHATLIKLEKAESDAIKLLGQANGELSRVEEDGLCRTAKWVALRAAVVKALEPWPEARRAVLEAIEQ